MRARQRLVAFAEANGSDWPLDLEAAGYLPGMTELEPAPWNAVLGPLLPHGGPNGVVLQGGREVCRWGDPDRVEMTFSVAKSYLALLAGLALDDGRISSLDARVHDAVSGPWFAAGPNADVTWRHLLEQTSEWRGTLWSKPDIVDHHREVGAGADNSRKGRVRRRARPGSHFEYNDVRVNVLALALTVVFGESLEDVLRARVMRPLGASDTWRWHAYDNAHVDLDGQRVPVVPGGTHWGGGLHIATADHVRVAQCVLDDGIWQGQQVLPAGWRAQLATPSTLNPGYGLLWWLNPGRSIWPAASANAIAALGAGSHVLLVDPDQNLVVVARWVAQAAVAELVERCLRACG